MNNIAGLNLEYMDAQGVWQHIHLFKNNFLFTSPWQRSFPVPAGAFHDKARLRLRESTWVEDQFFTVDRFALTEVEVGVFCAAAPNSQFVEGASLGRLSGGSVGSGSAYFVAGRIPNPGIIYTGPGSIYGVPLYGTGELAMPAALGEGLLCLAGVVRGPLAYNQWPNSITFGLDPQAPPEGVSIMAGTTTYLQFFYRDSIGGVPTSNLSNGISLTWVP